MTPLKFYEGHIKNYDDDIDLCDFAMNERGHLSFISGEQRSKNEGNKGDFGKRETKEIKILILGSRGL